MIEFTKQWVMNIVTLVLFMIMFEMLLPTGRMKKFVNLATGTILIIAIISPLLGLLGKNNDFTALQTSSSNYLERRQIEKESKLLKEEQMKQIVAVYRLKIIEQMESYAKEIEGVEQAKADIIFNENYNSKTFGEIKRAYLEIIPTKGDGSPKEGDGSPTTVAKVTRVGLVSVGEIKNTKEVYENCDPALKINLEKKISEVFGLRSENIIISQMKR